MRPIKLFSYVVDHDHGISPNPAGKFCTLVHCKFARKGSRRKNIVEAAEPGDWIMGTGGQSSASSGNGSIIYLMRVDEKISFTRFMRDQRFFGRRDQVDLGQGNKFALISKHFFYFGRKAIGVKKLPIPLRHAGLEKRGPGFRSDLPSSLLNQLTQWFEEEFDIGVHGAPCLPASRQRGISRKETVCQPECDTPLTICEYEEEC
jgi:hypothetical protein